jgi:hypothetical protein
MRPEEVKLGDKVYFFADNGSPYEESLFWVIVDYISYGDPTRCKYNLINAKYNMAACFKSAIEAINHKRAWLDKLEANSEKLTLQAK